MTAELLNWKSKGSYFKFKDYKIFFIKEGVGPVLTIFHGYPYNSYQTKVPADLKWPVERPKCCKVLVVTSMIDLNKGRTNLGEPQVMDITYSYKPNVVPGQTFEFEVVPGCLCITAISLQYVEETFIGDNTINSKSFNPGAILHAYIADGVIDHSLTKNWQPFDNKGYPGL